MEIVHAVNKKFLAKLQLYTDYMQDSVVLLGIVYNYINYHEVTLQLCYIATVLIYIAPNLQGHAEPPPTQYQPPPPTAPPGVAYPAPPPPNYYPPPQPPPPAV